MNTITTYACSSCGMRFETIHFTPSGNYCDKCNTMASAPLIQDISKATLLSLIRKHKELFKDFFIRRGDFSVSINFFNTKNSVSIILNIHNSLIEKYKIDLEEFFPDAETGL